MVIAYEVYLEITPEALRRIIDEHEAAKKNKIIEESN
jgi:(2Fe-2S) ferredoxin